MNKKQHWENIYETKKLNEVSWYQKTPTTAIEFIEELNIPKDVKIIDVGGGDSFFADYLVAHSFQNISVLDISKNALERAKKRLGEKANQVTWIESDASKFTSEQPFDFWYDRAAFHFLTEQNDINNYVQNLNKNIAKSGIVTIGTFSENGPTKCSGIAIKQYSIEELKSVFAENFECIHSKNIDHPTPFDTVQNFTFCTFRKK